MAANTRLNVPRLGRLGPRRRGDRGGRPQSGADRGLDESEADVEAARDQAIQQTDQDASSSRMSAVALGYLEDPFASMLYASGSEAPRRYPIINRGTYVRTRAIDQLVTRFLDSEPARKKQIVSLGAGSDTRFFRLCLNQPANGAGIEYHELDFEANVNQKRTILRENIPLARAVRDADTAGNKYHLNALDLRDLTSKSPPVIPNLESSLPTLLLSECCLCYLPPDTTSSILQYFNMHIQAPLALVLYEPIRPFDAFGKTMVSNLASRGIHMQTLKRFSSLEAQRQRLKLAGFADGQGSRDILQLWESDEWTTPAERKRVERLEWLDEVEEWQLLSSHYCVAWGWRGEIFGDAFSEIKGGRDPEEEKYDDVA